MNVFDPNRRPGPGVGITPGSWRTQMEKVIENASNVHDVGVIITSAHNSLNSAQEQLQALIDARASAPLNDEALRVINAKIGELAQFTHQHPDG